uniref:Hyaluronidase n=2 Tax=Paramormyrops kingsleyae TaxID=1676925 RepID=A0A3B3SVZ3_9TELE
MARKGVVGRLLLLVLCVGGTAAPSQPVHEPLLPGQPFLVLWGVPDAACLGRPDPRAFGMQERSQLVIFLEDSLGLYPYYTPQKQAVSGGLPQHTRLDGHLQEVEADLAVSLPSVDFGGLAVLYWDQWRPQWGRNMAKQEIYQEESRSLLQGFFPDWSPAEVDRWAQVDFETAAQVILIETLRKLKMLRPKALWGVSPYPNCYTSSPAQRRANHTGRCPATEMALNDELLWLWRRSSALYPLLQLDNLLGGTPEARLYASALVREALRVAALAGAPYDLPVFPLIRSVYTSTNTFLSEGDLMNTIGESAAMGAAGVIVWEKVISDKSQRGCWKLADFVREVLGPYVVNVTTASRLCSATLCRGRGRCVRREPGGSAYLHLPPTTFLLLPDDAGRVEVEGRLAPAQRNAWRRDFQCQWYGGLEGGATDEWATQGGAEGRGWEGTTSTIKETEVSESPRATTMTLKAERTPTATTTLTTEPASAPLNQSVPFLISSPLGLLLSAICILDFWLMC